MFDKIPFLVYFLHMNIITTGLARITPVRFALLSVAAISVAVFMLPIGGRAAGCVAPAVDYGTKTTSITVPADATYRLWSRMQTPDATNTSYRLEVDGNACFEVGGGIAPSAWTWVDYQSGNTAAKVELPLTAGAHTLRFIGTMPKVSLDRVIAVSNLDCVPVGDGENCNVPPDLMPPTVPANLIATPLAWNKIGVSWNASTDNIGVTGYMLYRNGEVIAHMTTATTFTDTAVTFNAAYDYQVAAFDETGNVSALTDVVVAKTPNLIDKEQPSKPAGLTATYVTSNEARIIWQPSTDNTLMTGYDVYRSTAGGAYQKIASTTSTSFADTGLNSATSYSYYIKSRDVVGNASLQSTALSLITHGTNKSATLIGYVRTASGLPVAGATVEIINSDGTTSQRTTNILGYYEFYPLSSGTYPIRYSIDGFQMQVVLRNLAEGARIANNVTMQVAQ